MFKFLRSWWDSAPTDGGLLPRDPQELRSSVGFRPESLTPTPKPRTIHDVIVDLGFAGKDLATLIEQAKLAQQAVVDKRAAMDAFGVEYGTFRAEFESAVAAMKALT